MVARRLTAAVASLFIAASLMARDQAPFVYRDAKHGFQVSFPTKPVVKEMPLQFKSVTMPLFVAVSGNEVSGTSVLAVEFPASLPIKGHEQDGLDAIVSKLALNPTAKVLRDDKIKVGGLPARHVIFTRAKNAWVESYFFIRGQRVFAVMSGDSSQERLAQPSYRKFFDSFQFVG